MGSPIRITAAIPAKIISRTRTSSDALIGVAIPRRSIGRPAMLCRVVGIFSYHLGKRKRPPGPCFAREGVKIPWCAVDCAGDELGTMPIPVPCRYRSEEHTSELQSQSNL